MRLITFDQLGPIKGISYSRDHLRRKVKAHEFPKPIVVSEHDSSGRRIAWVESEIDDWMKAKIAIRDKASKGA